MCSTPSIVDRDYIKSVPDAPAATLPLCGLQALVNIEFRSGVWIATCMADRGEGDLLNRQMARHLAFVLQITNRSSGWFTARHRHTCPKDTHTSPDLLSQPSDCSTVSGRVAIPRRDPSIAAYIMLLA